MSSEFAVVTGGAGFIGSHVVDDLIQSGYRVRVLDDLSSGKRENLAASRRGPISLHEVDLGAGIPPLELFEDAEFVIHLAGRGEIVPSVSSPVPYMRDNVMGTVNTLEAARITGVSRFVYAASSSCYGTNPPVPTPENAAIDLAYPYALSKWSGEEAAFHWSSTYGLSVNSIRIFNAYGLRARTAGSYGAVLGTFLRQRLEGAPLTVVGNGQQKRDFVFVTDVARAFVMAALTPLDGRKWNVGAGSPQTVARLAQLIGGKIDYMPPRPGEPDTTWADTSLIRQELGWQPKVSFEAGMEIILENIDDWKNAPLWDKASITEATRDWFLALDG